MEGILEILGKIGFDWKVALANLVNFLIIFFILKKYAFRPIGKTIKERQDKIDKGLSDAKKAEYALNTANVKKKEIIHSARDQAQKIVSSGDNEKKNIIRGAKDEAEKERENIIRNAKKDAMKEKKNAEDLFNKEASALVVSGIEKMVKSYVSAGKGEDIIKAMVRK